MQRPMPRSVCQLGCALQLTSHITKQCTCDVVVDFDFFVSWLTKSRGYKYFFYCFRSSNNATQQRPGGATAPSPSLARRLASLSSAAEGCLTWRKPITCKRGWLEVWSDDLEMALFFLSGLVPLALRVVTNHQHISSKQLNAIDIFFRCDDKRCQKMSEVSSEMFSFS